MVRYYRTYGQCAPVRRDCDMLVVPVPVVKVIVQWELWALVTSGCMATCALNTRDSGREGRYRDDLYGWDGSVSGLRALLTPRSASVVHGAPGVGDTHSGPH